LSRYEQGLLCPASQKSIKRLCVGELGGFTVEKGMPPG
jgi:hypothetical protein